MAYKRIITVAVLALLIFCPLFAFASDADTEASSDAEKSVILEFEKSDYERMSKVTIQPVFDILGIYGIPSISKDLRDFRFNVVMENVSYSYGYKSVLGTPSLTRENVIILSADFTIKLTALKNNAGFHLAGQDYISGEGYQQYISMMNSKYNKGEVIEFSGTVKKEYHMTDVMDFYVNSSSNYLLTGESEKVSSLSELNGVVKSKDVVCDFYYMSNSVTLQKHVFKFYTDLDVVRTGDECIKVTDPIDFTLMKASMKLSFNGEKKDVKVNIAKYKSEIDHPGESSSKAFVFAEQLIVDVYQAYASIKNLPLNSDVLLMEPGEIKGLIEDNGGKVSWDVNEFDRKATSVDVTTVPADYTIMCAVIVMLGILAILCLAMRFAK